MEEFRPLMITEVDWLPCINSISRNVVSQTEQNTADFFETSVKKAKQRPNNPSDNQKQIFATLFVIFYIFCAAFFDRTSPGLGFALLRLLKCSVGHIKLSLKLR